MAYRRGDSSTPRGVLLLLGWKAVNINYDTCLSYIFSLIATSDNSELKSVLTFISEIILSAGECPLDGVELGVTKSSVKKQTNKNINSHTKY